MLIHGKLMRALTMAGSVVAAPVFAADFTVNTEADGVDANPGDGVCETAAGNGLCTLRAAVMEANIWAVDTVDNISLPAGTYVLTLDGTDEQFSETGDLDVDSAIVITGLASRDLVLIDGNNADRVFDVHGTDISGGADPGLAGAGNLTLNSVTIQNGQIPSTPFDFPLNSLKDGGGINNTGNLVLNDCVVTGNISGGSGGGISSLMGNVVVNDSLIESNGAISFGAGIYVESGVLSVADTTITSNFGSAFPGLIGGGGIATVNPGTKAKVVNTLVTNHVSFKDGGGIYVLAGAIELINSTVTGNEALRSGGGVYINGGDLNNSGGSGTSFPESLLVNVTVTDNIARGLGDSGAAGEPEGGGVFVNSGNVGIVNSIVTDNNPGSDCELAAGAAIVSLGYNIDGDATCGFNEATDMAGAGGGQLLALADNGGPSLTHALVVGSVAENAADDTVCHDPALTASVDQRDFTRPATGCDIGAYESEALDGGALPPPSDSGNGQNVAPTALNVVFSTAASQPLVGVLLASDPDGDALMFQITRNGSKGTASMLAGDVPGAFSYVPTAGQLGTDSFDFLACEVATNVCSTLATATVFIVDAPAAQAVTVQLTATGAAIGGTTSNVLTVNQASLNTVVPDVDYNYPLGAFFFSVSDIPDNPTALTFTEVVLQLPNEAEIVDGAVVRKLDTQGEWQTLTSGPSTTVSTAVVDPVTKTITLRLIDNDVFDRNPLDGVIDDPVALGVPLALVDDDPDIVDVVDDEDAQNESAADLVNDFLDSASGGGGAVTLLAGLAALGALRRRSLRPLG